MSLSTRIASSWNGLVIVAWKSKTCLQLPLGLQEVKHLCYFGWPPDSADSCAFYSTSTKRAKVSKQTSNQKSTKQEKHEESKSGRVSKERAGGDYKLRPRWDLCSNCSPRPVPSWAPKRKMGTLSPLKDGSWSWNSSNIVWHWEPKMCSKCQSLTVLI